MDVVRQALDLDPEWIAASRAALTGVTFESVGVSDVARHRREAFNAAETHQFQAASKMMSKAVNAASERRTKGWLQEQLAVYQQHIDPAKAQQILAGALRENPRVTRPMEGVTYRRLAASADQSRASAAYISKSFADGNELIVGVNALLDDLVLDSERTDEFEEALQTLGLVLGFGAQRPERDTGSGPDVLWSIGELNYLVIECKSGSTSDKIWRRDVAQLAHSMSWFKDKYDGSCSATPVLVHPVRELEKNAASPSTTRIVTADKLTSLRDAVRDLAVGLSVNSSWKEQAEVAKQLRQHFLAAGEILSKYTVKPRSTR